MSAGGNGVASPGRCINGEQQAFEQGTTPQLQRPVVVGVDRDDFGLVFGREGRDIDNGIVNGPVVAAHGNVGCFGDEATDQVGLDACGCFRGHTTSTTECEKMGSSPN